MSMSNIRTFFAFCPTFSPQNVALNIVCGKHALSPHSLCPCR